MTQYIDERTAAALLGLDPRTLTNWRARGFGPPHYKFGRGRRGYVRYERSEIEAWMASRRRTSTSDPGTLIERKEPAAS